MPTATRHDRTDSEANRRVIADAEAKLRRAFAAACAAGDFTGDVVVTLRFHDSTAQNAKASLARDLRSF